MQQPSVHLTGVERTFGVEEVIVTKTDPQGRITYANDVFLRVAAYREHEVLGRPHNIVRHPAMPAACSSCCGTRSRPATRSSPTCSTWPRRATTTGCSPM
ncbi:MAG: PAS domain-containing protein [Acidimicrobiales bacterium]